MQTSRRILGTSLVISIHEKRFDTLIAADFRDEAVLAAREHRGPLVLDFTEVEFIDSTGLGAIVGIRKRLGWNVRIVLAGLRSPVYRVFELARVTQIFAFYTSVEAAAGVPHGSDTGARAAS